MYEKLRNQIRNRKTRMLAMLVLCLAVSGIMTLSAAAAAALPTKEECAEAWIYVYPQEKLGWGYLEFPNGTKFQNIKVTGKGLSAKKFVESYEGGEKHTFLRIRATRSGYGKLTFKAVSGKKSRSYSTKIIAMPYKNPYKVLKIGSKNYASLYKNYDNSRMLKKSISGKLTVTANPGFKITGIEIMNGTTGKVRKVKNGSKITLKKGEGLQVYYYYKAWKCNGGLGVIWIE